MRPTRRQWTFAAGLTVLLAGAAGAAALAFAHCSLRQGEAAVARLRRHPAPGAVSEALATYRRAKVCFRRASHSPFHRAKAREGLAEARRAMGHLVDRGFASGRFSPRDADPVLDLLPSLGLSATARAERALQLGRYERALGEVASARAPEPCRVGLAAALALGDREALSRHLRCLDASRPAGGPLERDTRGYLWLLLGEIGRALPLLRQGSSGIERVPLLAEAERRAGHPEAARRVIRETWDALEEAQDLLRLAYLRTLVAGPLAGEALPWIAERLAAPGAREPVDATQHALFAVALTRHGKPAEAERYLRRFLRNVPTPAVDARSPWFPLYRLQSVYRHSPLRLVHPDDLAVVVAYAERRLGEAKAPAAPASGSLEAAITADTWRQCLWRLHLLSAVAELLLYDAPAAERALAAAERHGAPQGALRFHRAVAAQVAGDDARLDALLAEGAKETRPVYRPWQAIRAIAAGNESRARALLKTVSEEGLERSPRLGQLLHRLASDLLAARQAGRGRVVDVSPTLSDTWPTDAAALRRDLSEQVLAAPRQLAAPPSAVFALLRSHPKLRAELPWLLRALGETRVRPGEQMLRWHLVYLEAKARGDTAAAARAQERLAALRRLARASPFLRPFWNVFLW